MARLFEELSVSSYQRSALSIQLLARVIFSPAGQHYFYPGGGGRAAHNKKSANARKRPQTLAAGEGQIRTVRNPWQTIGILAQRSLSGSGQQSAISSQQGYLGG
jgi:hypothetical protein